MSDWIPVVIEVVLVLLGLAILNFCLDFPWQFGPRRQCPECQRVYNCFTDYCRRDGSKTNRIVAARRWVKWKIIGTY